MSAKMSLTFKQKQVLCDEFQRRKHDGEDTCQESLARWAKETFSLRLTPHQSTISRILATNKMASIPRSNFINKRDRTGKHHRLEEALFNWVCDQYALRRPITGAMIRSKAADLQSSINETLPEESRISMKFSGGWLSRFQDRWGLKSKAKRRECKGAEDEDIKREVSIINEAIRDYDLKDIWNADEFGLFYKMAPTRTPSEKQLESRRKENAHISCLACCNATGTEKFPLMFIGKSSKPRCFNGKTGKALGYDYYNNSNAWVTVTLFYEWLERFDKYIHNTPNRKAILLIDNCSAHGTKETLPELTAVKVIFLSFSITSKIQPMEAGIIAAMKMYYRKRQMERALDLIECNAKDIFKVDQLTGMRWVTDIWNHIAVRIIESCWRTTGLIDEKLPRGLGIVEFVEMERETKEIEVLVQQVVGHRERMAIKAFLNPENEDICTEEVSNPGMVDPVARSLHKAESTRPTATEEMEEKEERVSLPPLKEQCRALAIAKLVVDSDYHNERTLLRTLERIQKDVRGKVRKRA